MVTIENWQPGVTANKVISALYQSAKVIFSEMAVQVQDREILVRLGGNRLIQTKNESLVFVVEPFFSLSDSEVSQATNPTKRLAQLIGQVVCSVTGKDRQIRVIVRDFDPNRDYCLKQ
ncbi:hypothetical protein ACFLZY_00945 [Patescibacteria group bacterium]